MPPRPRTGSRPDPRAEPSAEPLERDTVNRAIDDTSILSSIRISQQLLSSRVDTLEEWREEVRQADLREAHALVEGLRAKEAKRIADESAAVEAERAERNRKRYEWWRLIIASVLSFILAAVLAYAQAVLRK